MRNLAPDIFRQRLLIEGYYSGVMTSDRTAEFFKVKGETVSQSV